MMGKKQRRLNGDSGGGNKLKMSWLEVKRISD